MKLARVVCPFYAAILRALVRSLVFLWAILQFNQNVLRPYLWVHLAILASVYAAARGSVNSPLADIINRPAVNNIAAHCTQSSVFAQLE